MRQRFLIETKPQTHLIKTKFQNINVPQLVNVPRQYGIGEIKYGGQVHNVFET